MGLKEEIDFKLSQSLKNNEQTAKETLRLLKSAIKNKEIESGKVLNDDEIRQIIQKEIKKREEAQELYHSNNRPELSQKEREEAAILKQFLPTQLSPDEVKEIVKIFIKQNNLHNPSIGEIIKPLKAQLSGQTDSVTLASAIKEILGN